MWFRRDLRLADNPALNAAAAEADEVVPLFVIDPALWNRAGAPRRRHLAESLRALDASLDGALVVRHGNPVEVVSEVAQAVDADHVHAAFDFGPYGSRRDSAVAARLNDSERELAQVGSPYAVAPGRVTKTDGSRYLVFTPFHRAWLAHGWRAPAQLPGRLSLVRPLTGDALPDESERSTPAVAAGESAALERWRAFLSSSARTRYGEQRDRPDRDATSHLSIALKFGELHPRTVLADLDDGPGDAALQRQLAWREFYADVLHGKPASARDYLRPELREMEHDDPSREATRLAAWQQGRTGYPFVDAGMRQLRVEGWMHNRVRMVVASFLVKDLHLEWMLGARWFMQHLIDGDLANNSHGWQWVAGTGTDAAPYYRVFNPVSQGLRFDPGGDYVRRYVPELEHLVGAAVHEPWNHPDGLVHGYPTRVVQHDAERKEALRRYHEVRARP